MAQRLLDAVVGLKAAQLERDAAIVAALKGGVSTHKVAAITGMAQSHVYRIGKAGGWPTAAQRQAWDDAKRVNDEWRAWLDEAIERLYRERPAED